MRSRQLAVLSLFFLAGCVSGPMYIPPTGGDVATLTVLNASDMEMRAGAWDETCTFRNLANFKSRGILPNRLYSSQSVKVVIPAGKEFAFGIWASGGTQIRKMICDFDVTFTPNLGSDYYATFRQSGYRCQLLMREATLSGLGETRSVKFRVSHFTKEDIAQHNCR